MVFSFFLGLIGEKNYPFIQPLIIHQNHLKVNDWLIGEFAVL